MRTDHEEVVLAAIVRSARRDLLMVALQHLEPDHFRRDLSRTLYSVLEQYYNIAGAIIPRHTLTDLMTKRQVDTAKIILFEEFYDRLAGMEIPDHEFRYSIEALKDIRAEQLTGEAITTSMEVLERGIEKDGLEIKGHRAAREYLYGELGRVDRLGSADSAPEGDVRTEAAEIMLEYVERKTGKRGMGIRTGIKAVDTVTSGMQNGELILICAYTGQGKSMLATQLAWNAAIMQGKNVFFATSETIRPQVRRRMLARHSRLPQFGIPDGLNSYDLKNATLSPEMETKFEDVVQDFTNNPNYGKVYVAQVPRGGTLGFLEARLSRQQVSWNIDLVVIDYLALLRPDRKRQSTREEFNDIIKDTKVMATTFDGGRGIPVVSPWAMSQTAYREAERTGEYALANLAETSEAEKSADMILSLMRLRDEPNHVRLQFLKNRDGETPRPLTLEVDYRSTYLSEVREGGAMEELLDDF